ncbi:N-acetyltransferase ESCO2 [Syngnathus scovelli]|uniref:N-acetyltransferase ESCO2 n=1 Tax=Syngnathus scovelli TaxID=161590 RepID=UPI00210FA993|nr:N-acetyltransferase ESCO2 [Syngnathus scovelli]XP_049613539.1 N-acetyltransferase ESCO2 [Syngnathus scovelli]
MMLMNTRKRKLSSVDSDSHPAKMSEKEASPLKRRSPRKKPDVNESLNKEHSPWLRGSPRKAAGEKEASPLKQRSPRKKPDVNGSLNKEHSLSPRRSPRKAAGLPVMLATMTSSFYGPKKSVYLTPLERKAVKESLPVPPPSQGNKMEKKNKKVTKGKQVKVVTVRSSSYSEKPKTIKLSTMNGSSNTIEKSPEPKKPKPKLLVGAAFFSTGKKHSSMYKKASKGQTHKSKSQVVAAQPEKKQKQMNPVKIAVQPVEKKVEAHRRKFDPKEFEECDSNLPASPPKALAENYKITKELKIVLTRIPIQASFLSQDGSSKPVCDLGDAPASTPRKESVAVYPIFGSASKRSKSSPAGTPSTKERPTRRRKEKQDADQLIIDAGQKQFGAAVCGSCGMVYSADNPEDNFQHEQFHQCLLDAIKFVGWKKERVVGEFWDGKIVLVMPDDPKYAVKKADEVRRIADNELGFQQMTLSRPSQAKTYLFVNDDRMVVGCLVAEPIQKAFRVLEQPDQRKDMTKDDFMDRHRAWCCSTVPEKALCGVSRIWVFSLARHKGIASRMLDIVRSTFIYGCLLTKDEIAFSDPTPDGKQFATTYCGTPTFLVYNFIA